MAEEFLTLMADLAFSLNEKVQKANKKNTICAK